MFSASLCDKCSAQHIARVSLISLLKFNVDTSILWLGQAGFYLEEDAQDSESLGLILRRRVATVTVSVVDHVKLQLYRIKRMRESNALRE